MSKNQANAHAETAIVRRYLKALIERKKADRPRWADPQLRLSEIEMQLAEPGLDPIPRLDLLQERVEVRQAIAAKEAEQEFESLVDEFVSVGLSYSHRKGISYAAWRDFGVPAEHLRRARISS